MLPFETGLVDGVKLAPDRLRGGGYSELGGPALPGVALELVEFSLQLTTFVLANGLEGVDGLGGCLAFAGCADLPLDEPLLSLQLGAGVRPQSVGERFRCICGVPGFDDSDFPRNVYYSFC